MGLPGLTAAQEQALPGASTQDEDFMVSDTLSARYARLDRVQTDFESSPPLTGHISYERTLFPLNHAGQNVYQPLMDDPRLLNVIRLLKKDTSWDPLRAGNGTAPFDYNYNIHGATRNSQILRGSLERPLLPSVRLGYRFDARYGETWGPFPGQQTTRLDGLLDVGYRLTPSRRISVRFLGLDNGWHARTGNRVYTDRARYILENLNRWRARTGGFDISYIAEHSVKLNYQLQTYALSDQWASDPPDPNLLTFPELAEPLPFVDGVFPASRSPVFTASRDYLTLMVGGRMSYQANEVHRLSLGVESRVHKLRQKQFWQERLAPDAFDLTIRPWEFALFVSDRLRVGALVMDLGLRYDRYSHGTALWQDIYRTLGDDRSVQDTVRQLLLSGTGKVAATHLLSPHFSVSYPAHIWNVHMSFSVAQQPLSLKDLFAQVDRASSPFADRTVTDMRPQRLTTLEGGIGVAKGTYTADITAFYRDSERYNPVFGPEALPQSVSNYSSYWGRVNLGFRKQSGIELALIRNSAPIGRSNAKVSSRFSYLFLRDLGPVRVSNQPIRAGNPLSPGDFTTFDRSLNSFWNRRHWISWIGSVRFASGKVLSAIGQVQSGVPYRSPSTTPVGQTVPLDPSTTTAFGPWTERLDVRLDIPLLYRRSLPITSLFLEVRNLLNEENIVVIADPHAFERTGKPDNPFFRQSQWVYGPARAIWTGFRVEW